MWAVLIVVVVAVTMLYCAGLASTIARFVLLTTPPSMEAPPLDLTAYDLLPPELPGSTPPGPPVTPSVVMTPTATIPP